MWTRRRVTALLIGAVTAFALTSTAEASPGSARLRGVVTTEQAGLALPRVSVTLRSESHQGFIRVRATGPEGAFEFDELPAGLYSLEASHAGYKRLLLEPILVIEGSERREHLTLRESDSPRPQS